jgi:hypothetical protein
MGSSDSRRIGGLLSCRALRSRSRYSPVSSVVVSCISNNLVRAGPPEAGRATHQPKTEPPSPTIAEPSPVRRTPAGSPARTSERRGARRGRRLSPGQPVKPKPLKPVRARRCRPSSRSLWGVRIGSFNRRSKRRLSGGRPGRADRGWNLEAVVTGSSYANKCDAQRRRALTPHVRHPRYHPGSINRSGTHRETP